jgi:repressor of nif and glnA expression
VGIFGSSRPDTDQQSATVNGGSDNRQARKAAEKAETEQRKAVAHQYKEKVKEEERFRESPAGKARVSYQRGDNLFQVSFDIEKVQANVAVMVSAFTTRSANDVSEVLNSIVAEGWDFSTLSTAFVSEGEESRDKFLASGQQVAIRGRLVGTYVFTRKVDQPAVMTAG